MKKLLLTAVIVLSQFAVPTGAKADAATSMVAPFVILAFTALECKGCKFKEVMAPVAADAAAYKFSGEISDRLRSIIDLGRANENYKNLSDDEAVSLILAEFSQIKNVKQ